MSERDHLQEVIAKNPEVLGEDLLIISKEFSNWDNTNERLDLLALDKNENLVVIENKLDDSGKDVTWQVLKYASYVSTLTKDDIIDIYKKYLENENEAENNLLDFFEVDSLEDLDLENEKGTQRLLMVANNFRSEITSSAMWMIDNGIQVKCIEVRPYEIGKENVLNFEQIIPVKDMEEYLVKVALKTKSNAIVKQREKIKIYSIEHHLEGKSEEVKQWYREIKKYIFEKNGNFEEISRKIYIGYKINNRRIFRMSFNKNDFYLASIFGLNAYERNKELIHLLGVDNQKIVVKFDNKDEENDNRGKSYLQIFNQNDIELAKKMIDYIYDNLEEELEKTKRDYYKK